MDIEKIDRIKRKVAKLMALANNTSNANEADSAMRKAAILMANYHVAEGDVANNNIIKVIKPFFKGRKNAMSNEKQLFWAIAGNMGVYGLYNSATKPDDWNVGSPCHFTLVGNACDIEIAWYMFELCNNQIIELAKQFRREHPNAKQSDANDYKMGITLGLKGRFIAMAKTELPEGTGLVPVDARWDDAKQWYEDEGNKAKTTSLSLRQNDHLRQGNKDSSKVHLNAGVKGKGQTKRLK